MTAEPNQPSYPMPSRPSRESIVICAVAFFIGMLVGLLPFVLVHYSVWNITSSSSFDYLLWSFPGRLTSGLITGDGPHCVADGWWVTANMISYGFIIASIVYTIVAFLRFLCRPKSLFPIARREDG